MYTLFKHIETHKLLNKVFLILFISLLPPAYAQQCKCKYPIALSQTNVSGNGLSIKGGDTVCIESGLRNYLRLENFHGDSLNYIVFKNCGGDVIVENENELPNYGIVLLNCSFFRFTGSGHSASKYGIKILKTQTGASGLSIDKLSTNFEVDHIEIANTGFAGIISISQPTCDETSNRGNFIQRNVSFHDNYIHNTHGEGMYIGHSFYTGYTKLCNNVSTVLYPHEIHGLRVFNNLVDSCGWDGIQVGCAYSDCEIYGNTITNYGVANITSQRSGIQIGAGTAGKCYNNAILKGNGTGISVFGIGNNLFFNNIIVSAGEIGDINDDSNGYGIFCDDRSTLKGSSFNFINNTIIGPKSDGIRIYSNQTKHNRIYNNIILSPGSNGNYNNNAQSYVFYNSDVDLDISNNYFSRTLPQNFSEFSLLDIYNFTSTLPIFFKGKDVSELGVVFDFNNTKRPTGVNPDIGAFQYIPDLQHFNSNLFIYPNPNSGKFMIASKEKLESQKITIFTMNGMKIYEKNLLENNALFVNLPNNFKKGYYILSIDSTNKRRNFPLIIN
jgi:hypothetical protein